MQKAHSNVIKCVGTVRGDLYSTNAFPQHDFKMYTPSPIPAELILEHDLTRCVVIFTLSENSNFGFSWSILPVQSSLIGTPVLLWLRASGFYPTSQITTIMSNHIIHNPFFLYDVVLNIFQFWQIFFDFFFFFPFIFPFLIVDFKWPEEPLESPF